MKNLKLSVTIFTIALFSVLTMNAGNNDRAGEAGASELLINPWARSVGFGGANTASATGLEAMSLNIAGMAFTRKTELMFASKNLFVGSGVKVSAFGFSQKVGETGAIGVSVMSTSFGNIDITEVNNPEGGIGTFSPSYLNLDFGYSKTFSNSISGGLAVRIVSESIMNVSSRGFAFDAGIRYVTGDNDQMKFGIALKNVGPTMQASGDGLSATTNNTSNGTPYTSTINHRSAAFQLPSLLNIGASYDFYVAPRTDSTTKEIKAIHRITVAGNFTANSFTNDEYKLGVEYAFKEIFMIRGGYTLESATWFDSTKRSTAYTGPSFGASVVLPLGKKGTTLGIHYAYQLTENFAGTHTIGIKLDL